MKIDFFKYQGAGNDFVIIDNRDNFFPKEDIDLVAHLCHRKFGIGADGLMLLENAENVDFKMEYFNADGRPGSMCGNGGRCIVAFAKSLNLFDQKVSFIAIGSNYEATMENDQVNLNMQDVKDIEVFEDHVFLDTGSPHDVRFTEALSEYDVVEQGRKIRYGAPYFETGSNVNFVEKINQNTFSVRTYERGVEDETLSCGTGVTAVALASFHLNKTAEELVHIETPGGNLTISFKKVGDTYTDIVLSGPATFVFKGSIEI